MAKKSLIKLILIIVVFFIFALLFGVVFLLKFMPRIPILPIVVNSCKQDPDCISQKADCCGCNQGGKATAINKNYQGKWDKKLSFGCKSAICLQEISNDPSCFQAPKCVNKKCTLEESKKEVAISTDKTEYEQGGNVEVVLKNNLSATIYIDYPVVEKFENNSWVLLKGSVVWPGCWVTGGLPYLPLGGGATSKYQWDQKERWCSSSMKDLNTYTKEVGSGKYRIKSRIIHRTKSEAEDPNNILGQPSNDWIYSSEFTIKEEITGKELPFNTILKGDGYSEKKNYVIKSDGEWIGVLTRTGAELPEPIDFSKDMVVVVSTMATTGGYDIEIIKITESQNNVEVYVRQTSPGRNCIVTQATTSPYHIVKVQKLDKEVVFNVEKVISECR